MKMQIVSRNLRLSMQLQSIDFHFALIVVILLVVMLITFCNWMKMKIFEEVPFVSKITIIVSQNKLIILSNSLYAFYVMSVIWGH